MSSSDSDVKRLRLFLRLLTGSSGSSGKDVVRVELLNAEDFTKDTGLNVNLKAREETLINCVQRLLLATSTEPSQSAANSNIVSNTRKMWENTYM